MPPSNSSLYDSQHRGDDSSKAQTEPESTRSVPKVWGIDESLKYAPPRPAGDSWEILLAPLLQKDKMRCDAWKDEVQNLLIFAGLFSAVVTAFVIESYRSLQPDPNDHIINLLSHIATRLDAPLNSNSTVVSLPVQSFTPNSSSVRVNTFWLISLVLSLTTVLIGIIALQWLREHQSYTTDLTSREKYALCIMRSDGLKTWQVDKIFTTLPLLLQAALILFLGGVIDFLHAIGNRAVVIPVAVVVGLTLIFLIATTLLPCLQVSFLYLNVSFDWVRSADSAGSSWRIPPSQCPYKSPQSHAIRHLWLRFLRIRSAVDFSLRYHYGIWRHFPRFSTSRTQPQNKIIKSHFTRYLYTASFEAKWIDFDLAWLAIRDGYMRRFFKRSSTTEYVARTDIIPIFDIVLGLLDQRCYASLFPSAYHCVSEISELALQPVHNSGVTDLDDFCRQSAYLHDLVAFKGDILFPDCFALQSPIYQSFRANFSTMQPTLRALLHQQNLESFIPYHYSRSIFALPSIHRTELRLRLLRFFFESKHAANSLVKIPDCLTLHHYHARAITDTGEDIELFKGAAWQMATLTQIILQQTDRTLPDSADYNTLVQHEIIYPYMETSGYCAARAFETGKALGRVNDQYHSIFIFIKEHLEQEMEVLSATSCHPSLFFYVSSLFAHFVLSQGWTAGNTSWITTDVPFRSMCSAICVYRHRTIDMGIVDLTIENQLRGEDIELYTDYAVPFSDLWWNEFNVHSLSDSTPGYPVSPSDAGADLTTMANAALYSNSG